jgi:hypothetical protein
MFGPGTPMLFPPCIRPPVVAEVKHFAWTDDNLLRQVSAARVE